MNKTFFLPLIIVFFTSYYFLFPREGGIEKTLMPERAWAFSSPSPPEEALLISRGERKALYYQNGSMPFLPAQRKNSVLNESHYFYKTDQGFLLEDLERGTRSFVEGEGQPLLLNSRIYVVDLWKGRIQEYDGEGKSLWKWQGLGPVTALDAGKAGTVLGLLDGSVRIFDDSGLMREISPPSKGQDCTVYGLSLSPDGERLSVISGLAEQRIREYDLESLTASGRERMLESRFSRPVKMSYSPGGDILWVEQKDKVWQLGPEDMFIEIPQEGRLLSLNVVEADGKVIVLSEKSRRNSRSSYLMNLYSLEGALVSSMEFLTPPDDIVVQDGTLFFSMGGRILKMGEV